MPPSLPHRPDPLQDPSELARRAPVWSALSELFAAGELQDGGRRRVAGVLADSGYALAELETILRDEVAPVFAANLALSPAPELFGWSDDGVRTLVLEHLRRARRAPRAWVPTGWLRARQVALVRAEWAAVRALLAGRG